MKVIHRHLALLFVFSAHFSFGQNALISQIINEIDPDSLIYRAEEISGARTVFVNGIADTIKSRNKTKPGNELAYRFIMEKFNEYGLITDSLLFGASGKNALAVQPGTVYPNRYFIFCAHYDSMPNALISPAADDDGSGVAVVLEAARILSRYQFEFTILYAVWDEEEYGLAGSAAYASNAASQGDSIEGVLNMDAIAWDGNNDNAAHIHTGTTGNSLSLASAIDNVNTTYGIGLDLTLINPGATFSDHASFWSNGFGAVLLIQDWTMDSNPHYHTATDLVSNFNQPYYIKMSRLAIAAIANFAVPVAFIGEEEKDPGSSVKLFPNPAADVLYLFLPPYNHAADISCFSIQGEKLFQMSSEGNETIQLPVSGLSPGMYLVMIESETGSQVFRVIFSH